MANLAPRFRPFRHGPALVAGTARSRPASSPTSPPSEADISLSRAITTLDPPSAASISPPAWKTLSPSSAFNALTPSTVATRGRPLSSRLPPCPSWRLPGRMQGFHTYFVAHLPTSSLHPDTHGPAGIGHHKLPRDASTPHTPNPGSSPALWLPNMPTRDLAVVRIPLRRAKHHFGSYSARGSRPYNEDADQAGIIEMPAFAKKAPASVRPTAGEPASADGSFADPQIFYFALFDGHGGSQCSHFLRDELPGYLEEAAALFNLRSSLREAKPSRPADEKTSASSPSAPPQAPSPARKLAQDLVQEYGDTIGGYFKRFSPREFSLSREEAPSASTTVEASLTYGFLRADLDFVSAQAKKRDPDHSDGPVNEDEVLGAPHLTPSGQQIGGRTQFKGGSTASVALISTPTPAPFWHPDARSTLLVAHVGDSRVLLCDTATGLPHPLTSDHHPTSPIESRRLRRYAPAGSMVTGDSFGEERIAGLANSRAFGDFKSKRLGVSAEPELTRVELAPAQYSFLVLISDGVSGTLSDGEIVDIVKEAKTPEQAARAVVDFATEVSTDGDNATCQVVRLGGWERRSEGGVGSLGSKEMRDARMAEAQDPRRAKSY